MELFKIDKVMLSKSPIVYRLIDLAGENVKGTFYAEELQRTTLPDVYKVEAVLRSRRKRGGVKEYLVKWMGYPDSFNSWVNAKDISDL